jgi:hypothetical protein
LFWANGETLWHKQVTEQNLPLHGQEVKEKKEREEMEAS